jgi:hypothetical protein
MISNKTGENVTGIGSSDLTKYRAGIPLSAAKSARAKCADCQDNYINGKNDCEKSHCPLYPFMPYGSEPKVKSEAKVKAAKERFTKKKKQEKVEENDELQTKESNNSNKCGTPKSTGRGKSSKKKPKQ